IYIFVADVARCVTGRPGHIAYVFASDCSWIVHSRYTACSTNRVGSGIRSGAAGFMVVPQGLSKGTHPDVRPTGTRSAWERLSGQSVEDCYWFGRPVGKGTFQRDSEPAGFPADTSHGFHLLRRR